MAKNTFHKKILKRDGSVRNGTAGEVKYDSLYIFVD